MRILIVIDTSRLCGGAEQTTYDLRAGLQQRGIETRIFASTAATPGEFYADDTCLGTTSSFRTLLQSANPWAAQRLRQVIKDFSPDLIHLKMFLTQLSPLILPVLKGTPCLYNVEWLRILCPTGNKRLPGNSPCTKPAGLVCYRSSCLPLHDYLPLALQAQLLKTWQGVIQHYVACSPYLAASIQAAGLQPVSLIRNGVPLRAARPPLSQPPIVGFAGRIVPTKGLEWLIRAWPRVIAAYPQVCLRVIGEGEEQGKLQALAKYLGVENNIEWLGQRSREETNRLLEPAWIQVFPSITPEGSPLVVLEAMMRGTVVMSFNFGVLEGLRSPGIQFVKPLDFADLATTLINLLADPERLETLGNQARKYALAELSLERYVDRFIDLYQQLLQSSQSG